MQKVLQIHTEGNIIHIVHTAILVRLREIQKLFSKCSKSLET